MSEFLSDHTDSKNKRRNYVKNKTKNSWSCFYYLCLSWWRVRKEFKEIFFQIFSSCLKHRHFTENRNRHRYRLIYILRSWTTGCVEGGGSSLNICGASGLVFILNIWSFCLPHSHPFSIILAICENEFYVKI